MVQVYNVLDVHVHKIIMYFYYKQQNISCINYLLHDIRNSPPLCPVVDNSNPRLFNF
jgi:hypothetical protein